MNYSTIISICVGSRFPTGSPLDLWKQVFRPFRRQSYDNLSSRYDARHLRFASFSTANESKKRLKYQSFHSSGFGSNLVHPPAVPAISVYTRNLTHTMGQGDSSEVDDLADQIGQKLGVSDKKDDAQIEKKVDDVKKVIAASKELRQVARWIKDGHAKNIVVLTGAGVSVAAGIPDFRTPGTGLYDNLQKYNLPYPEAVFDVQFYADNPQPFCALAKEIWPGLTHSPTLTHSFLHLLSSKGLLLRNYTQNIDGLEFLAGIPAEKLVECHGHFRTASCIRCKHAADGDVVKKTIVDHSQAPTCSKCKSYVKPDIVFFGESLPDRFHKLLRTDVQKADFLLVMGTSLQVAPVSMIPNMVRCRRALFNRDEVMNIRGGGKDVFVEGDCDANVEILCDLLGWKEELHEQNKKSRVVSPSKPDKKKGEEVLVKN